MHYHAAHAADVPSPRGFVKAQRTGALSIELGDTGLRCHVFCSIDLPAIWLDFRANRRHQNSDHLFMNIRRKRLYRHASRCHLVPCVAIIDGLQLISVVSVNA